MKNQCYHHNPCNRRKLYFLLELKIGEAQLYEQERGLVAFSISDETSTIFGGKHKITLFGGRINIAETLRFPVEAVYDSRTGMFKMKPTVLKVFEATGDELYFFGETDLKLSQLLSAQRLSEESTHKLKKCPSSNCKISLKINLRFFANNEKAMEQAIDGYHQENKNVKLDDQVALNLPVFLKKYLKAQKQKQKSKRINQSFENLYLTNSSQMFNSPDRKTKKEKSISKFINSPPTLVKGCNFSDNARLRDLAENFAKAVGGECSKEPKLQFLEKEYLSNIPNNGLIQKEPELITEDMSFNDGKPLLLSEFMKPKVTNSDVSNIFDEEKLLSREEAKTSKLPTEALAQLSLIKQKMSRGDQTDKLERKEQGSDAIKINVLSCTNHSSILMNNCKKTITELENHPITISSKKINNQILDNPINYIQSLKKNVTSRERKIDKEKEFMETLIKNMRLQIQEIEMQDKKRSETEVGLVLAHKNSSSKVLSLNEKVKQLEQQISEQKFTMGSIIDMVMASNDLVLLSKLSKILK